MLHNLKIYKLIPFISQIKVRVLTISLMLSSAYKIPKFVLAVASKLTKLEAPNLRMLSLYSIYTPIPILMCVGLIVAQL